MITPLFRNSASVVLALSLLAVAGCKKTPASYAAEAAADAAAANASAARPTPAQEFDIDYGVLGSPDSMAQTWTQLDPQFRRRSPAQQLARFRHNELHPPQGTDDHIIEWTEMQEHAAYQRALFYSVFERAPQLVSQRDKGWLAQEEKYLIQSSCENRGSAGVLFQLSDADCKGVS